LGVLGALERADIAYSPPAELARGFRNARWPGRLEFIRGTAGGPDVLLDGAHNPAGIAALAQALVDLRPYLEDASPTVVMGVLANHWQDGMLDPLKSAIPG